MALARESSVRVCPAGCGRTVQPGRLLCGPCWSTVPLYMQAAVWNTWRDYSRQIRAQTSSRAALAAAAAYRRASDAATSHARKARAVDSDAT